MIISSRTPEGHPIRCVLCGVETNWKFSDPAGGVAAKPVVDFPATTRLVRTMAFAKATGFRRVATTDCSEVFQGLAYARRVSSTGTDHTGMESVYGRERTARRAGTARP